MKHKFIIGIDFDGTINDNSGVKIAKAREFGYRISKKQTHSSVMERAVPRQYVKAGSWRAFEKLVRRFNSNR